MHDYVVGKAVSIGIPLFLIVIGSFFFTEPRTHWWFLLIIAMICGYVHYIVGMWYQVRSFLRKKDSVALVVLVLLVCFSFVFCAAVISSGNLPLLSIGVIAYFILHGALNEKTILEMQTSITIPLRYFATLALLFIALMFAALEHDSFFFDASTTFLEIGTYAKEAAIEQALGVDPLPIALALIGFFFVSLFLLCFEHVPRNIVWTTTALGFATFLTLLLWHPVNYIYLFHLYLSYHFLVWSIVLFQKYKKEAPERVRGYVRDHALVLIPLVVLAILFARARSGGEGVETSLIFSVDVFISAAFIHITTSLMNESWFKRLLGNTEPVSPKKV